MSAQRLEVIRNDYTLSRFLSCLVVILLCAKLSAQQSTQTIVQRDAEGDPEGFAASMKKAETAFEEFSRLHEQLSTANPRIAELRKQREQMKNWYNGQFQETTGSKIRIAPEQSRQYAQFKSSLRMLTMDKFLLKHLENEKYKEAAEVIAALGVSSKSGPNRSIQNMTLTPTAGQVQQFRDKATTTVLENDQKIRNLVQKFGFSPQTVEATMEKVEAEFILEVLLDGYLAIAFGQYADAENKGDYQSRWIEARQAVLAPTNSFVNIPPEAKAKLSEMLQKIEQMRQ